MAKLKICNCGCGTEFIPTKLGQKQVSQSHYITWLINTPEGQKKQAEAKEKAKKIIEKKEAKNKSAIEWQQKANDNWLKFKREQKKETRSYQQELILTKKPFQRWCVLRDKANNINTCISCEKPFNNNKIDGGHHFKCEIFSGVIFHPFNVSAECVNCNQYNDGNLAQYTPNLIKKIGLDNFNNLKKLSLDYKVFSYPINWLREFRAIVEKKIRNNDFDNNSILDKLAELKIN